MERTLKKKILVCANPDLNYIDGSSIWAQTITLALAATGQAQVDFLPRSKPRRDEMYGPLRQCPHVRILATDAPDYRGMARRISLPAMATLAAGLDASHHYNVIVVRGLEVAQALLQHPLTLSKCWLYLTDIPQDASRVDSPLRDQLQALAHGCQLVLCQSQGFVELWQALVPGLESGKLRVYSPVIPDLPASIEPLAKRPVRAVYAGKFKAEWMTLEMTEAWPSVQAEIAHSELVMMGDKIHDETHRPGYAGQMRKALEKTPALRWLGAQSREQVQVQLQQARVGLSWRDENMNDTLEYSTKILEYGGAGCAAILNRNPLHEQLLGADYPLFANSKAEFQSQLVLALSNEQVAQSAAQRLQAVAARHTFSARVKQLRQWIDALPPSTARTVVLVAGHDLKFFTPLQRKLQATGRFVFLVDQWRGHDKHDASVSRKLLAQADVIFCEWCLGNLVWYSRNKQPHQRLVARFHLQERELPYVNEATWDAIDHISYVSEFIRREGQAVFGFPQSKTSVIDNLLDENRFTARTKTADARFTLGIVGVAPARKRLDRALDVLEALLEQDDRYCLRIKGRHPLEYGWLLGRKDELAYYQQVFERINSSPFLRHKVIFDPPGDDVNDWFTMVGFILSPSDFESFHMAVGEGALTGALPVIWNWDGASEIWGEQWIVHSLEQAVERVMQAPPAAGKSLTLPVRMASEQVVARWKQVLLKESASAD